MAYTNALCLPSLLPWSKIQWSGCLLARKYVDAESDDYVRKNFIFTKAVFYENVMIALTPKFKTGVPFSIVACKTDRGYNGASFYPYPSKAAHDMGSHVKITSAIDFCADDSNFLWVLDSGIINTSTSPQRVSDPKVFCINMITKQMDEVVNLYQYLSLDCYLENIAYHKDARLDEQFIFINESNRGKLLAYNVTKNEIENVNLSLRILKSHTISDKVNMCIMHSKLFIVRKTSKEIVAYDLLQSLDNIREGVIDSTFPKRLGVSLLGTNSCNKLYLKENTVILELDTWKSGTNKYTGHYEVRENLTPMSAFFDQRTHCTKLLVINLSDFSNSSNGCKHTIKRLEAYREY